VPGPDGDHEPLPPWKEFRSRHPHESDVDYQLASLHHGQHQGRIRDHWLSNQLGAVLGHTELLRRDLIGDGTPLRHGVLNQILDQQREIKNEQTRTREIIRTEIKNAANAQSSQEWSTAKKWFWGLLAMVIAAVVGSLTYLLAIGHP
jgi:hypothetical protein